MDLGFGFELCLIFSQEYIKEVPEIIKLPEEKESNVVIEGRPQNVIDVVRRETLQKGAP